MMLVFMTLPYKGIITLGRILAQAKRHPSGCRAANQTELSFQPYDSSHRIAIAAAQPLRYSPFLLYIIYYADTCDES